MQKAIILTLTLFLFGQLNSQAYLKVGGGYSTVVNSPALDLFMGVHLLKEKLHISGGYQVCVTSLAEGGSVFQGRMGLNHSVSERVTVSTMLGYAYHFRSADKVALNTSLILYALDIDYQTGIDQLRLYLGNSYFDKYYTLTIGLKCMFVNYSNRSCR